MKKLRGEQGFTVVETMIVLAIAGLILLVVLLAIPALERSSRNNERRQDVQTILAAVSSHELNNSGNMPQASDNPSFLQFDKLTYYDKNIQYNPATPTADGINVYISADGQAAATQPNPSSIPLDAVYVFNHKKCEVGGATTTGAGFSDVVALYSIETGTSGSSSIECQQL
jgi:prepilin-type N-terminal cleavage/methylation domain-containing protein